MFMDTYLDNLCMPRNKFLSQMRKNEKVCVVRPYLLFILFLNTMSFRLYFSFCIFLVFDSYICSPLWSRR